MGESSSSRSILPTLAARPPTPPRESSRNETKSGLIERVFGGASPRPAIVSNITPDSSADSPVVSPNSSTRKRVVWSNSTQYSEIPSSERRPHLLPLPPSAERKSAKSILKVNHGLMERDQNIGTKLLLPYQHTSFAAMLESIVQQLAGNEKGAKMDAYLMLAGSLKATGNLPDPQALKDKMGLLLQFITRDVQQKIESGKYDTPLVINSLLLLSSFLQISTIGESLNQEFAVFVVEHAIKVFEDSQPSKDIVKHLMFVLATQKFSPKIMNATRVGRLVAALHSIENVVKGKSIIMGRLNIYRTLVRQSRHLMIAHTAWLEDLFTDMLSSLKEIRNLAILFGFEASLNLGDDTQVSRAFSLLFDQRGGEHTVRYAQFYADKLRSAFVKEDTVHVPQVWSVIMLFLRGKPKQLEHWPFLALYTGILQECLNSSQQLTRIEANYAWNRFVFAVNPTEKTSQPTIKLLAQPLLAQLKSRRSSQTRKSVLGGVCNLFYYTMKPSSTTGQLEFFWDTYVVPLVWQCANPPNLSQNPVAAKGEMLEACSMMRHLLDPSFHRPWVSNRAMADFQQNSVKPRELPALDPKWARKNSNRIFSVLSPIVEMLFWDLSYESEVLALWQAYLNAISAAAVMEVTVNNDTMAAMASIFGLLHTLWRKGYGGVVAIPEEACSCAAFLKCFEKLVITTIEKLGIRPFIQRQLCIGTHDVFTPVATPSQRPSKIKGQIRTPLEHLFLLLAHDSPKLEHDVNFFQLVYSILTPFFAAEEMNRSRSIEVARDLFALLSFESTPSSKILWMVLANFSTRAVDLRDERKANTSLDQPIGSDYRNTVKILDFGISHSAKDPLAGWSTLFDALATSALLDAGVAGKVIAVLEPLAKCFMLPNTQPCLSSSVGELSYYHLLLSKAEHPRDRQAVDAAKKRLWGFKSAGLKSSSWDPFAYFYDYIKMTLATTWENFSKRLLRDYADMIKVTTAFVSSCPSELLLGMLIKIQEGIAPWIKDIANQLNGGNALGKEVTAMWNVVCNSFIALEERHGCNITLSSLEFLLCAGLESSHKSIASRSIKMWNLVFGSSEEAFEYPSQLQCALLRLRPMAEIQLPFIPESVLTDEAVDDRQQPLAFTESQDDASSFLPTNSMASILNKHRTPKKHVSPTLNSSPGTRKCRETTPEVLISVESSASRKRARDSLPSSKSRKSRNRQLTPKLRHDNSQIQFQAVEASSPNLEDPNKSQLLTDRQLEVKERQLAEAAMFPDLRSSPRNKSKSKSTSAAGHDTSEEPELPSRRSSSQTRTKTPHSERVLRQVTPTPLPPSEDDNFMVSSPTPKRHSQALGTLDPPSSPPVASITDEDIPNIHIEAVDEQEVPSSPPCPSALLQSDALQSSGYPSAQIDPLAIHEVITASAFGTFDTSPAAVSSNTTKIIQMSTSSADRFSPNPSLPAPDAKSSDNLGMISKKMPTPSKRRAKFLPSTPPKTRATRTSRQQVDSPPFVDARSSPPSSDRANEDIFEDAVTSPQLIVNKRRAERASPSLSDTDGPSMNDSSILRMMEDFDKETEESISTTTPAEDMPHRRRSLRTSTSQPTARPATANHNDIGSMRKVALKNAATSKISDMPSRKENIQTSVLQHDPLSPTASLVPETPAPRPAVRLMDSPEKPLIIGHDPDADDTIVVDTSALEREYRAMNFGKRRREDDEGDDIEEVDQTQQSQGTPAKKRSPKKRRGRPRKSSQAPSQGTESSFGSERSLDLPEPATRTRKDANIDYNTVTTPGASKHEIGNSMAISNIPGGSSTAETRSPTAQRDPVTKSPSPDLGMIEDTILDTTSMKLGPSVADNLDVTEKGTSDSSKEEEGEMHQAKPAASGIIEQEARKEEDASVMKPTETQSTFQALKARMQSVIAGLGLAAFSRAQVNEMEDIFMDAKENLYGAGRRGRTDRPE